MISDEMRELLSTYVDGELRDSDAVRVEEMSKRDPELRREIDAYRIMRRQLKAWDEAEHSEAPPASLRARALARARGYAGAMGGRGGRVFRIFANPLVAAALLLIAIGGGILLAQGSTTEPIVLEAKSVLDPFEPVEPGNYRLPDREIVVGEAPNIPEHRPVLPVLRKGLRGYLIDGVVWTENSLDKLDAWREEREWLRRRRAVNPTRPETVTGTWRPEMLALVRGYDAHEVPFESLVIFRHKVGVNPPRVAAFPAGAQVANDGYHAGRNIVLLDKESFMRDTRLMLAGAVLIGDQDRSGRTRVVRVNSWGVQATPVQVAWADDIGAPKVSRRLTLQPEILGPQARQQLVSGTAEDADKWLKERFKSGLAKTLKAGRRKRQAVVDRLVDPLRRDAGVTGFAVVADGRVLGVELFASHELMLAFAPRLLHGYVVEAGSKAISLEPPTRGVNRLQKLARTLMDHLVQGTLKLEDVGGIPKDVREEAEVRLVNIVGGRGRIAGHGILQRGRPVHITLFAE